MRTSEEKNNQNIEVKSEEKVITSPVIAENQSLGELKIHENVIASLVRRVTLAQDGVSRLSGNNFVDTIGEIVGSRRIQDRAIIVKLCDDNRIELEVKVVVKFGYIVPEVAAAIQKGVITEVENITGMTVVAVNVTVQDVEDEYIDDEDGDDDEE
ncbi:MAG: Asp23/Gls24 family envelope stress response protein [Lentisphaeria bacterium]|nr:Asp23/Gls24 family envelope stress response protein [Lentisphaeria bacterium]